MVKVAVTEECVFQVNVEARRAYEFFSKPQLFRQAMDGVLRCEELEADQVHWLLEAQADQGIRFQPDYSVNYVCDGSQSVRWEPRGGNLRNEGQIRIVPRDTGGCEIHYCETVEPDLPISPLLMKLVKPLIIRELRRGLRRFVERAQHCLSN